jgi:hypothetical protein
MSVDWDQITDPKLADLHKRLQALECRSDPYRSALMRLLTRIRDERRLVHWAKEDGTVALRFVEKWVIQSLKEAQTETGEREVRETDVQE